VGPTASGKSALALRVAEALGGEVVSCDSLQVYRGCDIGSAKPSPAELARVPHHLVDVVDPDQPFNAADWARLARQAIDGLAARGRIPIVAGGTGLYLRALLHGMFEGPGRDPDLRARLQRLQLRYGSPRLHRVLARVDPATAQRVKPQDPVRIVRALEVYRAVGRRISDLQAEGTHPLTGHDVHLVGIDPGREALREAIERRTDAMLSAGLLGEVEGLLARYDPGIKPLQAIGYREAAAVVRGELTVDAARRDIVAGTVRYAKRQRTWFRHQEQVAWFPDAAAALAAVRERVHQGGAS
jgi:tRNA dimethylallyltransferase